MQVSPHTIKRLRQQIQYGDYTRIAKELGVEVSSVTRVLKGDWVNMEIIEKAVEIIEERKKELAKLDKKVEKLAKI